MEIENDSNDTQIFQSEIGVKIRGYKKIRNFVCEFEIKNVQKLKIVSDWTQFFQSEIGVKIR